MAVVTGAVEREAERAAAATEAARAAEATEAEVTAEVTEAVVKAEAAGVAETAAVQMGVRVAVGTASPKPVPR